MTRPKCGGKRRVKDNAPYHHAGNLLLHPLTGKTGRIILHRKIKYKREFVIDYWRIGGLVDFISRRDAERQRAQRVFWSCDFAQGIAEWDCGIGGLFSG